jgi:RNA polymerase sigma-70 factor (ECF subfamily)
METYEIRQVVEQVLAGETREFARLVEEFGLPVRAFIHSRVQARADAEDLAQETFIAAFRGLGKYDLEASFEAWLIGIARHRVQGHFRSKNRRQAAQQHFREACLVRIEAELDAVEKNENHHQLARLMDCIEQLPERMRKVVRARLREERGAATAERLQISRGAVYMLQLRANGLLRDCMTLEPE